MATARVGFPLKAGHFSGASNLYQSGSTGLAGVLNQLDGRIQDVSKVATFNVAPIADPATATAEDVATKVNEIITALTPAG